MSETKTYTKKQKVKHWLKVYDWVWGVPLGVVAFIFYPIVGASLLHTEDFGFYDPSIFHAAIYTGLIMVFMNMIVQLGIMFNHKSSYKEYYNYKNRQEFLKYSLWKKIWLYCFWYVFYSLVFLTVWGILV
jgi:hypothetical protein